VTYKETFRTDSDNSGRFLTHMWHEQSLRTDELVNERTKRHLGEAGGITLHFKQARSTDTEISMKEQRGVLERQVA
jgi:hypothetical protein